MTERIGKSEAEVLEFLGMNPRARNIDISTGLNEDKANVSNRLKRMKKKGLVKESSDKWSLTENGISKAFAVGVEVGPVLKNYWYSFEWIKNLHVIDEVLLKELSFWGSERNKILGEMFEGCEKLKSTGLFEEEVMQYAFVGMFKSYLDKKMKSKQMTKNDFKRVSKALVKVFPHIVKVTGYDKYIDVSTPLDP